MPILKVQASSSLTCLFQAFRLLRHVASVFPPCVRGMSVADVQAYFKEVIDEMTAEHGKPPTAKQLASVTGLAVNEAADVLATLVPKEPPVKKRKRRQQPEDPAQEEPVKEAATPSEVPETAEAEAVPLLQWIWEHPLYYQTTSWETPVCTLPLTTRQSLQR